MRSITNLNNISDFSNSIYVLVNRLEEINYIIKDYPNKDMIFRLLLTNLDEELLNLLASIPYKIEIIYEPNELEDEKLQLLEKYRIKTNSKVYISYNIEKKCPYDRAILIYYINRYGLISLLKTSNHNIYQEWVMEMTKYTSKNNVRKLNRKYIIT